jgi:hypothetical protein
MNFKHPSFWAFDNMEFRFFNSQPIRPLLLCKDKVLGGKAARCRVSSLPNPPQQLLPLHLTRRGSIVFRDFVSKRRRALNLLSVANNRCRLWKEKSPPIDCCVTYRDFRLPVRAMSSPTAFALNHQKWRPVQRHHPWRPSERSGTGLEVRPEPVVATASFQRKIY